MAKISQSQVQAAIAAIVERKEPEGAILPEYVSLTNQLWIRRNRNKHLEPIYAELAKRLGLDESKIKTALAGHQDEVRRYLKEQEAETGKRFAVMTKHYREALANNKAALEQVIVKPPIGPVFEPPFFTTSPPTRIILDKPVAIFSQFSNVLVEDHIESWNSWAKLVWSANNIQIAKLSFFFSWLNDSADAVVVESASSWLTARGKCSLHVGPDPVTGDWALLSVWGSLGAYLGSSAELEGERSWIAFYNIEESAEIWGGSDRTDTHDIFRTVGVSSSPQILVAGGQLVIFAVEMQGILGTLQGNVKLELDQDPNLSCPYLSVGFADPLIAFSETLNTDDANWQGNCLVQRIEPVRLSRGGTHIKLILRASSVSSASIDRLYISQADPARQPFDSAGDLTKVHDIADGSPAIVIPANTAVTLSFSYSLDAGKPLLIAVDFSAAPPSGISYARAVPATQATAWRKLGAAAAIANRAGFTSSTRIYLIEEIQAA